MPKIRLPARAGQHTPALAGPVPGDTFAHMSTTLKPAKPSAGTGAGMPTVWGEGVRRPGIAEAYIRHIVTRGVGDLGLDPRNCAKPSVIIIVDTIRLFPEEVYETGVRVVTAGTPIPQPERLSP